MYASAHLYTIQTPAQIFASREMSKRTGTNSTRQQNISLQTYMHTYIYIYMYIHTHNHTHLYIYVCKYEYTGKKRLDKYVHSE